MKKNKYYLISNDIKDKVLRIDLARNAEKIKYLRSLLIANRVYVAHDNPHIPTHTAQQVGLDT